MYYHDDNRKMPDTYQSDKSKEVLQNLARGESCTLVGLGSAGKSNFLRHVTRADVKIKHLNLTAEDGDRADKMLMVLLDPHNLIKLEGQALELCGSAWPGYELMISRLWRTLVRLDLVQSAVPMPDFTKIKAMLEVCHDLLISGDPIAAQSGMRSLENAIYELIVLDNKLQIVFILDDIEAFRHRLPDEFFESLRGLRDDFKGRITYLVTARNELEALFFDGTAHADTVEAFVEMFHGQTFYLDLLREEEVAAMVKKLIVRYRWERQINDLMEGELARDLYSLTVGHVGLIRRSFDQSARYHAFKNQLRQTPDSEELLANLSTNVGIAKECLIILNGLTYLERQLLHTLIHAQEFEFNYVFYTLCEKNIIDRTTSEIKIPLLKRYIEQYPEILAG